MKPSEMTNEELAKLISEGCGTSFMGHAIREAAARVRALSTLTTRTDNSEVIAELQRRLKVAEDCIAKLAKIDTRPVLPYTALAVIRHNAKNALAAIREEGGAR